ncbi:major facilitator superfamily domain-containing protein [Aspergillus karnatakaensis]|uniref:major facilitator superfamily domain-containing protein n=1 Tax=Aspergillus karnatakaensis TaxID=1810916 RepID=UPI003CCD9603
MSVKAPEEETRDVSSQAGSQEEIDPKVEKGLLRRLDWVLLPTLCTALLYLTHTLDRANLGNAKTATLDADLGLVGNQYSIVLILFYVPYSIFNIPATVLANRFNPAVVIPCIAIGWGSLAMITTAVTNFGGLLACRLVLGIMEAGFLPCAVFYCSLFYTRKEMAFRLSFFFMMGFIAVCLYFLVYYRVLTFQGAIGGLISADGSQGWQYLFLIEGAMGVTVGSWSLFWLPRDVQSSRFFTEEQKRCHAQRMAFEKTELSWIKGLQVLKDWKTWAFATSIFFVGVGSASSSNFLPVMIKRITQDTVRANLFTIGPNLVAATTMMTVSWFSDRTQQRAWFAIGANGVALIGWILFASLDVIKETEVGYFLTYLIVSGTFLPLLLIPAWVGANTRSSSERAVALGLISMFQNLGGIVSSGVYRDQDAPTYRPALITVSACLAAFLAICISMRVVYSRMNKALKSDEEKNTAARAPYML